ncbi:putative P450 monooxygenase [Gloeopeniophorella convolvens]|nr:putative P450 monooxygenase [Gloeopeniophorella convolvens]
MITFLIPLPSLGLSVATFASAALLLGLFQIVRNLFFHPLAHFPGPRGAACSRWWLAYMELVKGVNMPDLRAQLHEKYDVVRIAPDELHFSNPNAYNEIYNAQNKWDKVSKFYGGFDIDESFFSKADYHDSKRNRALVSNLFSRKAISELQYLIKSKMDILCSALVDEYTGGKSSDLYLGFQCFSADTITTFCFATSFDQLAAPGFRGEVVQDFGSMQPAFTLRKYSPAIVWLTRNFPPWLLVRISPATRGIVGLRSSLAAQIRGVLENPTLLDEAPHRTIYRELLNPDATKGRAVPTSLELQHEAELLFTAGSHTVAATLTIGVHYLLRDPAAKQRLVDEVREAWPVLAEPPSFEVLERLPFLTAVIKESLRIAPAVPSALPRIVPPSGATIAGVVVPGGVIVGQSALFVSFSEKIFPQPHDFLPERWLGPDAKSLENWLVAFSKGPRSCLGINLAYCELYFAFAYLFRRVDVQLDKTKPSDLSYAEHFVSVFTDQHLRAYCRPLSE